ncbi:MULTISPECIES: GNAT family N-acetyltransferase [unclassified Pseudoalteromonas]|uniref:GNAT family N-acetyltransferase n=1 Tax=unclassified Pseudoalteromonas TaxID=194690 RepID=UPI0025B421B2|nr:MULTISPECIES: GNAT family N-acetyltransferase [unclassified Pseudoalteromonas]MDN3377328.1 GNAT family N-acetyltransferase [Pseudoalteromonas sp. APC 3893]MDN3385504.1 GNAT family N-acetyltransferase [Pseudoalteromonas sp. APC 4017]
MQLIPPQESHLVQMLNWFESEKALREWAGPDFRFPFDLASFTDDLQLNTLNSLVLISTEGEFLGFGQFYLRVRRCHLARLVVNPRLRGKGYASILIEQLCEIPLTNGLYMVRT